MSEDMSGTAHPYLPGRIKEITWLGRKHRLRTAEKLHQPYCNLCSALVA
jgi:hypothetical protein